MPRGYEQKVTFLLARLEQLCGRQAIEPVLDEADVDALIEQTIVLSDAHRPDLRTATGNLGYINGMTAEERAILQAREDACRAAGHEYAGTSDFQRCHHSSGCATCGYSYSIDSSG